MPPIEVAAFYKFAHLPQFVSLRAPLHALCDDNGAKGILLNEPSVFGTETRWRDPQTAPANLPTRQSFNHLEKTAP